MSYSAALIGNNILVRSFANDNLISPMKLQRILFFVASEYAKKSGEPLLNELFQPWGYGPVIPSLYETFRCYEGRAIRRYAQNVKDIALIVHEETNPILSASLDHVWIAAQDKTPASLSRICQHSGSAWYAAWKSDTRFIDDDDISNDYTYRNHLGLG